MFRDTAAQDRPVERAPLWRRHPKLIAGGVLVLLVAIALLPRLLRYSGAGSSVDASRVVIATVERGRFVRDFAADGRIVAAGSPTLYAAAAGSVTLKVRAGDAVVRDQVLAIIDSPELQSKLSQERAALQGQQFDWRRAQLQAERGLADATDTLAQAQVEQKTAQRELDRSRKAYELGSYSELQLLRSEDALEKANFHLDQARRLREAEPEQGRVEVQGKKALLERQQALVNDLTRQTEALQLRSPVDGQVGQLQIADRATVARDAALLSVVDLTSLEVELQLPESFARDVATGMSAELSGNGGRWQGTVSGVSPEVVNGQVVARVRFGDDKPRGLRQNQRMSVRILIDSRDDVLMVARGSFVDQGGGYAWRVTDGLAVKTPVRLGASSITQVEVLEGLQPGDRVVVSGTDAFNDADRIILSH